MTTPTNGMTVDELARLIARGGGASEIEGFVASGGSADAVFSGAGWPLLHVACENQNVEAVRALVRCGADLNRADLFGQAPLHIAVDIDIDSVVQADGPGSALTFEMTRLLLSLGADAGIRDGQGRTARDWAAGYGEAALGRYDAVVGG